MRNIETNTNTTLEAVDLSPIVKVLENLEYRHYVYPVSLTTPPCTEGVLLVIPYKQPFPITVRQFDALKKVLGFNSRYVQNTLGRPNLLPLVGTTGDVV
jgi:carbonic anhydrase